MRIPLRALALLTGALALAACDDGPIGSGPTPTVSFTYSGPVSGQFQTEGALRRQSDVLRETGSTGILSGGELEVRALLYRPTSTADVVTFSVPRTTTGVETITEGCAPGDGCARLLVGVGLPVGTGRQAAQSCSLTQGTIHVTELTPRRARGEFSGTGVCISDQGEVEEGFTVTGGRFDVALR